MDHYSILGGQPETKPQMIAQHVKPRFGEAYEEVTSGPAHEAFREAMRVNPGSWKWLYRAIAGQVYAKLSPCGTMVYATYLQSFGISGSLFVMRQPA
jgi:hypothetical protein